MTHLPRSPRSKTLGGMLSLSLLVGCHYGEPPTPGEEVAADPTPAVLLDGERMAVHWSDGDTFWFTSGPHLGAKVRLLGFNALESYGPVHRWGQWTAQELYTLARSSHTIGESRNWECERTGQREKDGYGRLLLRCPEAALALVGQGHAHVMALDEAPSPALLAVQQAAQQARRGIWARGVPPLLLTSVHSADDEDGGYNRVVDTRTGRSSVRAHRTTYETCQEVCEGPSEAPSCMVYVPYAMRYRDRPACLAFP